MVPAYRLTKQSYSVGEACALCKEPFQADDTVVPCPVCGAIHHTHCWQLNSDHCTTLGCAGGGQPVVRGTAPAREDSAETIEPPNAAPTTPTPPERQPARAARPARRRRRTAERESTAAAVPLPEEADIAPEIANPPAPMAPEAVSVEVEPDTVTRARPAWHTSVAQSCLILATAIAIIVMAFSFFGLWMMLDYLFVDVLNWNYLAPPLSGR